MRITTFLFFIFISQSLFCQDTINPQFIGGEMALYKFLSNNIVFPEKALEQGLQGRVFLTFIIEPDSSVSNIRVLSGPGDILENEAIRVINLTQGMWIPGYIDQRPIRTSYNLPIKFTLNYGGGYNSTRPTISFLDTYKKGCEYLEKGMYKTASKYFACYQVENEINLDALYAFGLCKYLLNDYKDAILCWEKAKELGYDSCETKLAEAYFQLGNQQFEKENYQIAIAYFTKTLENSPIELNALYNRGISYLYIGDKDNACKDWNKAKELGSTDAESLLNEYCNN